MCREYLCTDILVLTNTVVFCRVCVIIQLIRLFPESMNNMAFEQNSRIINDITLYIEENYNAAEVLPVPERIRDEFVGKFLLKKKNKPVMRRVSNGFFEKTAKLSMPFPESIMDNILANMDKGFAETLFYYIDKKGCTDVECYKKSNVNRKTFSKIKCNPDYKPGKYIVLAFAIGLRLEPDEANHLLSTAGLCLSHSDKFDLVVEYFLKTGNYTDIFEVNEVLYQFDLELLGSVKKSLPAGDLSYNFFIYNSVNGFQKSPDKIILRRKEK